MNDKGFFRSPSGDLSSKRLIGISSSTAGILLFIAMGIAGFFIEIKDPASVQTAAFGLSGIGAGLLGVGVLDDLRKRPGVNNMIETRGGR